MKASNNYEIKQVLHATMTAGELKRLIEDVDDDQPVLLCCDYGDISHTQQLLPIRDALGIQTSNIKTSGYSKSGIALIENDEDDDDREEDEERVRVLVLR